MQITIEIPEELGNTLAVKWGNIPECVLESLAIEGYRRGIFTLGQIRQLLNLESFYEVEEFLKEKQVNLLYSETDLDDDLKIVQDLMKQ
jgi:predicted HTH domain antitoxin